MTQRSAAPRVANKIIRHAQHIRNVYENMMLCPDCKTLPEDPVTGLCGHSRCTKCIRENGVCPCGAPQPNELHCNILMRDMIENMISTLLRLKSSNKTRTTTDMKWRPMCLTNFRRRWIEARGFGAKHSFLVEFQVSLRRMIASPCLRYQYACELIEFGRMRDAAAHFAYAAASSWYGVALARKKLTQVIKVLHPMGIPRSFTRSMYRIVRQQSLTACIDPDTVECPVCLCELDQPITTPCGHTFCRYCLKRTMDTRKVCPLCNSSLDNFHPTLAEDNEFLCVALGKISIAPTLRSPTIIPIFACTVAYPTIPCPMMILGPELRNVVKSVLDIGSRRFGVLGSLEENNVNANYGTVVEIRDCVVFEDGRSIVSTVGINRFRVVETYNFNGCLYARVKEHNDVLLMSEAEVWDLQALASRINIAAELWFPRLTEPARVTIEECFGRFPEIALDEPWWEDPNGPEGLWWLIAILPINTDIQMLMLRTKQLLKRMTAVLRVIDAYPFHPHNSVDN